MSSQRSETTTETTESLRPLANAIRFLSADAVQAARSGHPGMPMGMADVATVLFGRHLTYLASEPQWHDRDRFVLSAGHGSMLLYSLLYLSGYEDFDIEQLKSFRQLGSRTAGHPEYGAGRGVECTTGPLGQGLAMAVGMAIAEKTLASQYGSDIVDHHTYVIAGDGCLMEGISQEAITLAGHLKLNKLIVLFDDNSISIDGDTSLATSEDTLARFVASGWKTLQCDGHNYTEIDEVISEAKKESNMPVLIACKTKIGCGAPNKQGTASTHGAPLGDEEIEAARQHLGWSATPYEVPNDVLNTWREFGERGKVEYKQWSERVEQAPYRASFIKRMQNDYTDEIEKALSDFKKEAIASPQKIATRKASQLSINAFDKALPHLLGGSADLTGSNLTKGDHQTAISADQPDGRYIHYGIREHGMAAAMNGIALHGGFRAYGGTFLVFADYCRPSIRLSALMRVPVIYVMTHDSIGLGEDGPTHQPVEHLASLRAIPNLWVIRPCDPVETAEAWALALTARNRPTILALSRQGVPQIRTEADTENMVAKGGYVINGQMDDTYDVCIVATGTEVSLALETKNYIESKASVSIKVVSMPSIELFRSQSEDYQHKVLSHTRCIVGIEAGIRQSWDGVIGREGLFFGVNDFGESAPATDVYSHFGLTAEKIGYNIIQKLG